MLSKVKAAIKWYLIYVVSWCVIFFFIFGTVNPDLTVWQWLLTIPSAMAIGWFVGRFLRERDQRHATD